jgi:phosphatidylethanolamine/phosphatidyl-N-methylethanolamine N-methyltransferase
LSAQKKRAAKTHAPSRPPFDFRLGDEARFIRTWLENPRRAGAIAPSGRFLARAMANCVDPAGDAPIVELGPGTGPVTQALLARGIAPERLVLVEYDPGFCHLLAHKFPGVQVVRGDAYRLAETLAGKLSAAPAAIVSSLPLLTRPEPARIALLRQAFELMGAEGRFIQFTYGVKSPAPARVCGELGLRTSGSAPIWLNLPPARIYVYRHVDGAHRIEPRTDVLDKLLRQSRRFGQEIRDELDEARARLAGTPFARVARPMVKTRRF